MHLLTSANLGRNFWVWDSPARSPYINSKEKLRRHANKWQKGYIYAATYTKKENVSESISWS